MDKVFEALERLKNAPDFMGGTAEYRFNTNSQAPLLKDYELVKQTVTELKQIKEANPSEAMKCVERLNQTIDGVESFYDHPYDGDLFAAVQRDVDTINQSLQRLELIDKAIEICKKANEQKFVYTKESWGASKMRFNDNLDYEVLNDRLYVNSRGIYYEFYLKEYGTFWALTKEELK